MNIETRRSADAWKRLRLLRLHRPPLRRPLSSRKERQLRSRLPFGNSSHLFVRTFTPLPESMKTPYAFQAGKYGGSFLRATNGLRVKTRLHQCRPESDSRQDKLFFDDIISWKYLFKIWPLTLHSRSRESLPLIRMHVGIILFRRFAWKIPGLKRCLDF